MKMDHVKPFNLRNGSTGLFFALIFNCAYVSLFSFFLVLSTFFDLTGSLYVCLASYLWEINFQNEP